MWQPIKLGPYRLDENALVIAQGSPSLDEAQEAGHFLAGLERSSQRWLGMWFADIVKRWPEQYSQLLDAEHFDEKSLRNWAWVVSKVPAENWKLDAGVSFSAHQSVAGLDPVAQRKILIKAARDKLTLADVRQEVRQVKRRSVAEGSAELAGKYRVAYLTPDWEHVTIAQLEKLPLAAHLRPKAAVFLWCPEARRFDVAPLLEAWGGLTHRRAFIWHTRAHGGADAYLSTRHQHLLWWTRGSCPPDRLTPMLESVVSALAPAAGGYPDVFRRHIERLYDGPRVRVYGDVGSEADGWTTYGGTLGAAVTTLRKRA